MDSHEAAFQPYELVVKIDSEKAAEAHRSRDLNALITNGHHMETTLHDLRRVLQIYWQLKERSEDLDLPDPTEQELEDLEAEFSSLYRLSERETYEWDKRARRTGVDWWNPR